MAKREDIEDSSGKTAGPEAATAKSELPKVESPPISPGTSEPAIEPIAAAAPTIELIAAKTPAPATPRRIDWNASSKRNALLAASVAIAAAFGAVIGAVASGGFATTPARDEVAGLVETEAMRQTIAQLGKEVTTLKASIEASNKAAHSQIAKITERFDRASSQQDITGSISAPQSVPAAAPLPTPRPAPRVAAVETQPPARPPVVQGWTIRDARDGFVYVESHGEVYQVVPGAPLPGLGPVESIKRQDGRWMVVTPKGIIVSMRDRRYFESF